jgi:hypothetical protein
LYHPLEVVLRQSTNLIEQALGEATSHLLLLQSSPEGLVEEIVLNITARATNLIPEVGGEAQPRRSQVGANPRGDILESTVSLGLHLIVGKLDVLPKARTTQGVLEGTTGTKEVLAPILVEEVLVDVTNETPRLVEAGLTNATLIARTELLTQLTQIAGDL